MVEPIRLVVHASRSFRIECPNVKEVRCTEDTVGHSTKHKKGHL